jgi:UDP-glucose 4-epimerase
LEINKLSKPPHSLPLTPHRYLITGGCGFIGSVLVAQLLRSKPAGIRVLDNFSVGTREDLFDVLSYDRDDLKVDSANLEIVKGDIRDYNTCDSCCRGMDVIIHLAANTGVAPSIENPRYDMEANIIGTFNLLEAARNNNVKNFVFASSSAVIGEVDPPVHEEKVPKPISPYGVSKLAGEAYCSSYYKTFGINTVSLRFGNVYGPFSKHKNSVVAKFMKQAFSGETLEIYGDGYQTRDFIYIDDLINAIRLSVDSGAAGETFQIATHRETTVNEIAKKIKHLMENEAGIKVDVLHGSQRSGDVRKNYSDISKARRMLGFSPEYDIDKGLKKTFEYFRLINR